MKEPKVTVITPSIRDCSELIGRFIGQDYPDKELIIISDTTNRYLGGTKQVFKKIANYHEDMYVLYSVEHSIGAKRNAGVKNASGSIIVHMDDDDLYASDWISTCVRELTGSNASIVGLNNAYFYDTVHNQLYEYNYQGAQKYVCGATMAYHKSVAEQYPFQNISEGEDSIFCAQVMNIRYTGYKNGFAAIVHGNNTCSHKAIGGRIKEMRQLPLSNCPSIIKEWYP
jgi:glycosyltransferase involved in cell wall biosynthesis